MAQQKKYQQVSPWDALELDVSHPDRDKQEKLRIEIKRKYRACFESDAGKWVLEHLNGLYFNRPVVDVTVPNPQVMAGIREGEMGLLRYVHLMMQPEE